MNIITIPQKPSNSGTIHDIASDMMDREIRFPAGHKFAIVLASYYGGRGYTTHKTEEAAIAASKRHRDYSHEILGDDGTIYTVQPGYREDTLISTGSIG